MNGQEPVNIDDFMKKKGRLEFTKFLERRQSDMGLSNPQMADLLDMPVAMYLAFKDGYLEAPSQKLLHQIATRLGMRFEELRKIAEKRYW